jgi:hypothetical protein
MGAREKGSTTSMHWREIVFQIRTWPSWLAETRVTLSREWEREVTDLSWPISCAMP